MATDLHKSSENPLRTAMDRAGDIAGRALGRGRNGEEPYELTEMADDRRPMGRVAAKLEVLSYIDAIFTRRTPTDGTIVAVSRERLIEDLTDIFMKLDNTLLEASPQKKPNIPEGQRS